MESRQKAQQRENVTIILVSHDMEDVYEMSERILLMEHGRIVYDEGTGEFLRTGAYLSGTV